jgi:metal-sulfur cluster biosynthetic enzyme
MRKDRRLWARSEAPQDRAAAPASVSPRPAEAPRASNDGGAPPGADADRRAVTFAALGEVWDPELALDVVSLGLVYDVRVQGERIEIDMTLTTPGCPVSEQLPAEATEAVQRALPDADVTVNLVWDPPWTPELLSDEAVERLGIR